MSKDDKYKHLRDKVARDVRRKPGKIRVKRSTEDRVVGRPEVRN